MRKRTYLGHIVENGKVEPRKSKLHAMAQFALPVTKRQV